MERTNRLASQSGGGRAATCRPPEPVRARRRASGIGRELQYLEVAGRACAARVHEGQGPTWIRTEAQRVHIEGGFDEAFEPVGRDVVAARWGPVIGVASGQPQDRADDLEENRTEVGAGVLRVVDLGPRRLADAGNRRPAPTSSSVSSRTCCVGLQSSRWRSGARSARDAESTTIWRRRCPYSRADRVRDGLVMVPSYF